MTPKILITFTPEFLIRFECGRHDDKMYLPESFATLPRFTNFTASAHHNRDIQTLLAFIPFFPSGQSLKEKQIGQHKIMAWAESQVDGRWVGLASISPPIPDSWTGGPGGASLLSDGVRLTEEEAETAALEHAILAVRSFQPDS